MYDKFSEQFQKSLKPASELLAVNAKALEKIAQQQTSFITGMMNDGVAYTRSLAEKKDLNGVLEAQKSYAEELQDKIAAAAKENYAVMTETQEKISDVLKDAFAQAREKTEEVVAKATKGAPGSK